MKGKLIAGMLGVLALLVFKPIECRAEIAGDEAFSNLTWEQVYEEDLQTPSGVVQSICATENYIICIENTADYNQDPDTVSAYYKNSVDENGNPVQQFSLAKRVCETNWEHGNGMAYNPNTHEIYVALYSNQVPESRGCLFVMNPDTLQFVRSIKITDDYNILGIGYKADTNQYVIQTNSEGGYSFKILDENFQVVDDLGAIGEQAQGENFQDLMVDGDYVMNFPLTLGLNIGDYLNVFSLSRRAMVTAPQLNFGFQGILNDEPEGLCTISPGVYVAAVNVTEESGARKLRFYRTEIPYYFQITTSAENGTVTESGKVLRGENYEVTFAPQEGYQLGSLMVDGQEIGLETVNDSYVFEQVQADHQIQLRFDLIPVETETPTPTPTAETIETTPVEGEGTAVSASAQPSSGGFPVVPVVLAMLVLVAGLVAFYIHLRLERKRRYLRARARRRRQKLKEQLYGE